MDNVLRENEIFTLFGKNGKWIWKTQQSCHNSTDVAQLLPDNRVNERRQKGFLNSEQTGLEKFAPGVHLNTPKATATKSQISFIDAKLDPRFQNLMRSLTPIDC